MWTNSALPVPAGAELDVRAPRLERLGVAAGRDLAVRLLARQPHLDVVGLRRREPHVAGAQQHRPIRQLEALQDFLGVRASATSSSSYDCSGVRELHELDLVELVLADQPAHVRRRTSRPRCGSTACTRCSAAAASRPSRISPRCRFVSGTSAVGIRYRSQSPAILNRSCSNFGRLPVPRSASRVDEERRLDFGVAVLARVQVEHEVDERAREPRAGAASARRSARPTSCVARSKSRMPSAGPRSQCGLRLEVERARRRRGAALPDVVRRALPDRHGRVRQVRQRHQQRACAAARPGRAAISSCLICCAARLVGGEDRATRPAPAAWRARPRRRRRSARASAFELGDQPAPRALRASRAARARRPASRPRLRRPVADLVEVIAHESGIEHALNPHGRVRLRYGRGRCSRVARRFRVRCRR